MVLLADSLNNDLSRESLDKIREAEELGGLDEEIVGPEEYRFPEDEEMSPMHSKQMEQPEIPNQFEDAVASSL
jgi:hypothetical protein